MFRYGGEHLNTQTGWISKVTNIGLRERFGECLGVPRLSGTIGNLFAETRLLEADFRFSHF